MPLEEKLPADVKGWMRLKVDSFDRSLLSGKAWRDFQRVLAAPLWEPCLLAFKLSIRKPI
jgi:hypothetical protein